MAIRFAKSNLFSIAICFAIYLFSILALRFSSWAIECLFKIKRYVHCLTVYNVRQYFTSVLFLLTNQYSSLFPLPNWKYYCLISALVLPYNLMFSFVAFVEESSLDVLSTRWYANAYILRSFSFLTESLQLLKMPIGYSHL